MRAFLACLCVAGLAVTLWVDSLRVRIGVSISHSRNCIYRLARDAAPGADVLIMGSSRARQSVDPDMLAEELGIAGSRVVNTAHPNRNPWIDWALLDAVATGGKDRLVLVEMQAGSSAVRKLKPGLRRDIPDRQISLVSGSYDMQAIGALRYADLWRLTATGTDSWLLRAYDVANLGLKKIEYSIKVLLKRNAWWRVFVRDSHVDPHRHNVCALRSNSGDISPVVLLRRQKNKAATEAAFTTAHPEGWMNAPLDGNDFLSSETFAQDHKVIGMIAELARARGFRLVFYYLPAAFVTPPAQELRALFEKQFGVPLLFPDREFLAMLHPHYYDQTHLNADGMRLFTGWIAGELGRMRVDERAGQH